MKNILYHIVTRFVKIIFEITCRIDKSQLHKVPPAGPLVVLANHINFLEAPVIYTQLYPRKMTGLAKIESWKNPVLRVLFNLWDIIPIERGTVDNQAFDQMRKALGEGKILAVAPEGTRSKDGKLQRGYPGITLLNARVKAPILPLVHYGGESYWTNLKKLKRTDFNIVVGAPFTIDFNGQTLNRDILRQVTDELMYQMAALLPPEYRGYYSDLSQATETYLRFENGSVSNLERARQTPSG